MSNANPKPRLFGPGDRVICVDDKFDPGACEWADRLPESGGIYTVRRQGIVNDPRYQGLTMAVLLRGFGRATFDTNRFAPYQGEPDVETAIDPHEGEGLEDRIGFPYLVVRIYACVYQAEPIEVRQGRPAASVGFKTSYVSHPEPYAGDGTLSEGCRAIFIASVLGAVKRTGFRMCPVWGPKSCSFCEKDGSVNHSDDPPSGGIAFMHGRVL